MLEEVTLGLEQVARLQDHGLGLAQDGEVEHAGLGVALALVYTHKLRLDGGGDALEQVVTHDEHGVYLREVVGGEHAVDAAVYLGHLVVYAHQVGCLFARETLVVVVYVFVCGACYVYQRLGYLAQVVDNLHVVEREFESRALEAAQRGHERIFEFAALLVYVVRLAYKLLEGLAVLLEYGDKGAVVDLRCELHHAAHLLDDGVDGVAFLDLLLLYGLLLGLEREVALEEHVEAYDGYDDECHVAAPDEQQARCEGYDESADGRREPSDDYGHDARDAVYGAFASPRLVGERRSHRHHETYVCGREG